MLTNIMLKILLILDMIEYNGLKLLCGPGAFPGSGKPSDHKREHEVFNKVLDCIEKRCPVMIEVGAFWALWSLLFKQRFEDGRCILIEPNKAHLEIGRANFELNGFEYSSYPGGVFIQNSDSEISREIDFFEVLVKEEITRIDILHMDIQGSELAFLEYLNGDLLSMTNNIVVATHSGENHCSCKKILHKNKFIILHDTDYSKDLDGFLCAKNDSKQQ